MQNYQGKEGINKKMPTFVMNISLLFEDQDFGAKDGGIGLLKALAFHHPGDVLVVWK